MTHLFQAIGFLTVLPVPTSASKTAGPDEFGRCAAWFPFVGAVIGSFLIGLHWLAGWLFPNPLLAPVITVAGWAWITGGLHLDGLADCCDGLFASVTRERRLEIMRDPRMGVFGGIGLTLFLFVKAAAVAAVVSSHASIAYTGRSDLPFALLFAPVLARYTCLFVARQPSARPGGLGDAFKQHLGALAFAAGLLLPLGLIFLDPTPLRAAVALTAGHLATLFVILFARNRLGGMTGDVLGLSVELTELAVLLVYASRWA
jgi:adenosylcobinamide-GDP ribazoletransferase